ncbi:MAG: LysR family transcriptional regulator [Sterolibacterium sp.]|jgi:DNA-binding transcriptional LysR family regulator
MYTSGRRLHYFVTIADLGSLGRAAEALHIAQPALSRQLRLLEESVGTPLLERHARGVTLTPAGHSYYASARRLLDDATLASAQAVRTARGEVGRLGLGILEIYAWHESVLRALHTYRQQSPGITFTIEAMLSGAVTQRVLDGHLDMALAYTGPLADDGPLAAVAWIEDTYLLALHEDSELARRPPRRLADLNDEDFILFRRDRSPRLHDLLIHHFHQHGLTPRIVQEGTTHYTVLGLVAAGLGCTVTPASAERRLPPGVKLMAVADLDIRMPINLVWRKDNPSPLIPRFVELLCGHGPRP